MRGFRILVNPLAREGAAMARLDRMIGRLSRRHPVERRAVRDLGAARVAVRGLPEGWLPVAAGGDGTMNLLARALREEGLGSRACATLPLGTGNAFAHSIGVGTVRAAVRALLEGVPRAIDLLVTSHPDAPIALVSITTGFEARVIGRLARRRTWRRLMAAWESLPEILRAPVQGASLTLDGAVFAPESEPHFNLGLYNMRCYAFGRNVLLDADPSDGIADAVACPSARSYGAFLWRGIRRQDARGRQDGRTAPWRHAVMDAPAGCQFDGESARGARFEVRVEARALHVCVPPTVNGRVRA